MATAQLEATVEFSDQTVKGSGRRGFVRVFLEVADLLAEAGQPYAVVGGLAVSAFRRPRMTDDIDVLVIPAGAPAVVATARRRGFSVEPLEPSAQLSPMYALRLEGVETDLLVAESPLEEELVSRAIEVPMRGRKVRVAAAEWLIGMKLTSDRPRDEVDVLELLTDAEIDLSDLRALVARLLPNQVARLERLVSLAAEDRQKPRRKGRRRAPH